MSRSTQPEFLRQITQAMASHALAGQSDCELVERYLAQGDERVFEVLVRTHGPMVYRVCLRVLHQQQDAEDAFQATFLLLAQNLKCVRKLPSLSAWLHSVARRVALRAKMRLQASQNRECSVVPAGTKLADDLAWREVRTILDEEVSKLPDKWRIPLVLYYLEERTQEEAAAQLRWSTSTIRRRLDEAREALGLRLKRRGVSLSAALSAILLSDAMIEASLPPRLFSSTLEVLTAVAAGRTVVVGAASARVALFSQGVLRTMSTSKLHAAIATVLIVSFAATCVSFLAGDRSVSAHAGQPPVADKPADPLAKEPNEPFTAWGKEINGMQAGLGFRPGEQRAYTHGETVTLVVRVRNVSKEDVKFQYLKEHFMEMPPTVTGGVGKTIRAGGVTLFGRLAHVPVDVSLAPGKEIELHDLKLKLGPASEGGSVTEVSPDSLHGKGKFQIQYEQLAHASIDPNLTKLATGKLELEVKEPEKQPQKKEEKDAFTAWGKEVGGLQAGLGFRRGERRAYHFGEGVKVVARIRNLTKEEIEFQHIWAFFVENAPQVTDPRGKVVRLSRLSAEGEQQPRITKVPPDKEVELYEWDFDLDSGWKTNHGVGKFTLQCEKFVGPSSGNPVHPNPKFDKLATGKLELEVKNLTAWGKEINGLQAGLGYRFGEQRTYALGEAVKIVIRVRNVGKEPVEFKRNGGFYIENPPTITSGDGKTLPHLKLAAEGRQLAYSTTIAPGKEVDIYEWSVHLRPEGENGNEAVTIHGTGKFTLQCERVVGPTTGNPVHPDPQFAKLATGKLDLEVADAKPPAQAPEKPNQEKAAFTVWGKEVGGLEAGLGFLPGERRAEYHHGEKFKLAVKLRNVGKNEVKFTQGTSKEFTLAVTDIAGNAWTVAMPLHNEKLAPPAEHILKPGETVILAEPVVAVESTDALKLSGILRVDTPTMYVDSGNYKVAFTGMLKSHPTLATAPLEIAVRDLKANGVVVDEDGKPLSDVGITILRKVYLKDAEEPKIEEFGKTKTDAKGRFEIKSLYAVWESEPRSGFHFKLSAPGFAPGSFTVGKGFDPDKEIKVTLKR